MNPGTLRDKIVIESPIVSNDNAYGEPITTWTPFATAYAQKEDLTGREAYYANAARKEATMLTRFTIRYVPDLTATMRIVSDGEYYDIQSIAERRDQLTIIAERQHG